MPSLRTAQRGDSLNAGTQAQERQFKVPSLRGVAAPRPYMGGGQFATLGEVVDHYNAAPEGHSELIPLNRSQTERRQLELEFLLSGVAAVLLVV